MSAMPRSPVRSRDDFIVFGAPQILEPEIEEVLATLRSSWIGTGPRVAEFEHRFAKYKGTNHAIAVASCTAAMHLGLLALGVGPGDEVITSALTFCATVNVIIHAGATPVLADVDPLTMNIDPVDLERRITPRTRAIIPVHFAGRPCDMEAIMRLARRHDLLVLEDCAHAIETEYYGIKAGTFGDLGCFSFYATKNVATGEGGMAVTSDEAVAANLSMRALHGLSKDAWRRFSDEGYRHYFVVALGFKYNMTDLQAALGIHQLARVEENWRIRQAIWKSYEDGLAGLPIGLPAAPEAKTRHAHHLFTVQIDDHETGVTRDCFIDRICSEGVGVGVHYLSIAEHPYYRDTFEWRPEEWPNAMTIGRQTVSLPISPRLAPRDVEDVMTAVRLALERPSS